MAKEKRQGLGKGLGALFGDDVAIDVLTHPAAPLFKDEPIKPATQATEATEGGDYLTMLAVDVIEPNPYQPRKHFNEDDLVDLTESIRAKGVLTPLLVVKKGEDYILVAGERRLRAAKSAGLAEVPVMVRELDDAEIAQVALIENVQRTDLNAIEEARGYKTLIDTFGYTQQKLAELIGKSRPYIANLLRLLDLPEPVMDALEHGKISAGHARALLGVKDKELACGLCSDIIAQDLSVRALEALIQDINDYANHLDDTITPKEKPQGLAKKYRPLCDQLSDRLQTKVVVSGSQKKGKLSIEFYGDEDLTRILDALGISLY